MSYEIIKPLSKTTISNKIHSFMTNGGFQFFLKENQKIEKMKGYYFSGKGERAKSDEYKKILFSPLHLSDRIFLSEKIAKLFDIEFTNEYIEEVCKLELDIYNSYSYIDSLAEFIYQKLKK